MSNVLSRILSKLNFSIGGKVNYVGLSIGASCIKAVEMKKNREGWTLEKYAAIELQENAIENREIINTINVIQTIEATLRSAAITSKSICSAVIGSSVIVKTLSIVVEDMKELADQVFWEAEQYIPFDISEVVVDFQVIGKGKEENQVEVIIVAVKKDYLEQYTGAIESARLSAGVMDAEFFALQNVYELNYPVNTSEAVLLADVGAFSTKIVICSGGVPLLVKDATFGGSMITQEIQRELKLPTLKDAESLKVSQNLPHEVSEIILRLCPVLGAELKKSVDFYTASSLGPPVSAVLLSGGGSRAPHLAKTIEDYTGLPTQFLNPFQTILGDAKTFSQDVLMSIAPEAVIPIGLAMRAGDKDK